MNISADLQIAGISDKLQFIFLYITVSLPSPF
jgi:hypothetical protein